MGLIHPSDLPQTLPLFPLPGALLLPRSRLPLHLFEPRYLQMLEDALKTPQRLIGMIQPHPTETDASALHKIGCAGRVTQFSETDDGRIMVTLTGISRFRILTEYTGFAPYRKCDVDWHDFAGDIARSAQDNTLDRHVFLSKLATYLENRNLSTDWDALTVADDELLINSLSMLLDFTPEEKQAMLEAPTLTDRREILATLIDFALRGGYDEDFVQ
jgi:Lon protease-like protein